MALAVTTRSYDNARTGANTQETVLTPALVGSNMLVKRFSLDVTDDPRIEAQPLFVSGVQLDGQAPRDIVYVCTMANNVWAFDADTGQAVWPAPVNLGPPLLQGPQLFDINKLWGILSTRWSISKPTRSISSAGQATTEVRPTRNFSSTRWTSSRDSSVSSQ